MIKYDFKCELCGFTHLTIRMDLLAAFCDQCNARYILKRVPSKQWPGYTEWAWAWDETTSQLDPEAARVKQGGIVNG